MDGVLSPSVWDAGSVINSIAPASRVILTKGNSGDGNAFLFTDLTPAQQAELNKDSAGVADGCGPERLDYLRGDAANEGATGTFTCASTTTIAKFRPRPTSKLGDIVNSGPLYVGAPRAGYLDVDQLGYEAFSSGAANRTPVIYVGANDGALHGFNACIAGVGGCTAADEGKELLAYVPNMVFPNLSRLTDKNYNTDHRYFVDGTPFTADVNTGTASVPVWKSVLVGGMNGGGQGYFALDVTNPASFTAANAANLFLWEFTDADDADMGYSHNLPPVNRYTAQAQQIVQMENGKWAVLVGNGYRSVNGQAVLYVLFIKEGMDGVWTPGSDYIKYVADPGPGNGLSTPMPLDTDGNGLADVIYAGDLKGNMWKFKAGAADLSATPPAPLLLFAAGTGKPITAPPVLTLHPDGGTLVLFGTGKYQETSDVTDTSVQALYGIWDAPTAFTTVTLTELIKQTHAVSGVNGRTTTSNAVTYSTSPPIVKGWYGEFAVGGERSTAIPALDFTVFKVSSIIPSASPCSDGKGQLYDLDYLTGSMQASPTHDTDGDGDIDASDGVYASWEIGFSPGGVTEITGPTQTVRLNSKSDGTLGKTPGLLPPINQLGRINWRELIQ
jgi:type IV pilus assembly protein PilY1